jgi:hypothetical protein
MNSNQTARPARRQHRQGALERIGEYLEQDTAASNEEFIRRMRQSYFADVDALQKTGQVKLPE